MGHRPGLCGEENVRVARARHGVGAPKPRYSR